MALLREQRNLIRALYDFYLEPTVYARRSVISDIGIHLGSAEEVNILAFLKTKPILLSDKSKNITAIQQNT